MTILLQFASLYDRQEVFVWSDCLLDLGTERIRRIVEIREILMSFQTGFNLVNAAVVCAILELSLIHI